MNVLISAGCGALTYMRLGYMRVMQQVLGFNCFMWNKTDKWNPSAFDIFDEFKPDVFMIGSYELDDAIIKCLIERPYIKLAIWCPNFGYLDKYIDTINDGVLMASENDKKYIYILKKNFGDRFNYIFTYYHDNRVCQTHDSWINFGVKPIGMLMAADVYDYPIGIKTKEFECDIGFCGGYWPYKGINLDKTIIPLCHPSNGLKIKIFGSGHWPVAQHTGILSTDKMSSLFASAKISPNIFEPLSTKYGFDINERAFKVLSSGGFCVSEYVESAVQDVFTNNEMVFAEKDRPDTFIELVKFYCQKPELRVPFIEAGVKSIYKNHTYHHRVKRLLDLINVNYDRNKLDFVINSLEKKGESFNYGV